MNISETLKKFSNFMPQEQLLKAVELPASLCPEELDHILPSIALGGDGPFLRSLFLVTKTYLCEVNLAVKGQEIDFIARRSVLDYRLNLSQHELKISEEKTITYDAATVTLLHHSGESFTTIITYVGEARHSWLKAVLEALPISLVAESG